MRKLLAMSVQPQDTYRLSEATSLSLTECQSQTNAIHSLSQDELNSSDQLLDSLDCHTEPSDLTESSAHPSDVTTIECYDLQVTTLLQKQPPSMSHPDQGQTSTSTQCLEGQLPGTVVLAPGSDCQVSQNTPSSSSQIERESSHPINCQCTSSVPHTSQDQLDSLAHLNDQSDLSTGPSDMAVSSTRHLDQSNESTESLDLTDTSTVPPEQSQSVSCNPHQDSSSTYTQEEHHSQANVSPSIRGVDLEQESSDATYTSNSSLHVDEMNTSASLQDCSNEPSNHHDQEQSIGMSHKSQDQLLTPLTPANPLSDEQDTCTKSPDLTDASRSSTSQSRESNTLNDLTNTSSPSQELSPNVSGSTRLSAHTSQDKQSRSATQLKGASTSATGPHKKSEKSNDWWSVLTWTKDAIEAAVGTVAPDSSLSSPDTANSSSQDRGNLSAATRNQSNRHNIEYQNHPSVSHNSQEQMNTSLRHCDESDATRKPPDVSNSQSDITTKQHESTDSSTPPKKQPSSVSTHTSQDNVSTEHSGSTAQSTQPTKQSSGSISTHPSQDHSSSTSTTTSKDSSTKSSTQTRKDGQKSAKSNAYWWSMLSWTKDAIEAAVHTVAPDSSLDSLNSLQDQSKLSAQPQSHSSEKIEFQTLPSASHKPQDKLDAPSHYPDQSDGAGRSHDLLTDTSDRQQEQVEVTGECCDVKNTPTLPQKQPSSTSTHRVQDRFKASTSTQAKDASISATRSNQKAKKSNDWWSVLSWTKDAIEAAVGTVAPDSSLSSPDTANSLQDHDQRNTSAPTRNQSSRHIECQNQPSGTRQPQEQVETSAYHHQHSDTSSRTPFSDLAGPSTHNHVVATDHLDQASSSTGHHVGEVTSMSIPPQQESPITSIPHSSSQFDSSTQLEDKSSESTSLASGPSDQEQDKSRPWWRPKSWKKVAVGAAVGTAVGVGAVAAAPVVLTAVGFSTAGGVVAGGVAAVAHSAVGHVALLASLKGVGAVGGLSLTAAGAAKATGVIGGGAKKGVASSKALREPRVS